MLQLKCSPKKNIYIRHSHRPVLIKHLYHSITHWLYVYRRCVEKRLGERDGCTVFTIEYNSSELYCHYISHIIKSQLLFLCININLQLLCGKPIVLHVLYCLVWKSAIKINSDWLKWLLECLVSMKVCSFTDYNKSSCPRLEHCFSPSTHFTKIQSSLDVLSDFIFVCQVI